VAQSAPQSNNKAVVFRGRPEREMPVVSKAQNAAMHAAATGKSTLGIPAKVGKEFVRASVGTRVKRLPKHVRRAAHVARRKGLISEKAAKAHFGE
jgi:hypothetical protein